MISARLQGPRWRWLQSEGDYLLETERPPEINESDDVQRWLRSRWFLAKSDRDNERAKGPRAFNVGAAIAGHKMGWVKELIAERFDPRRN